MEKVRSIGDSLQELRELIPDAADYLELFIDGIADLRIEGAGDNSHYAQYILPNLEEDQNELMGMLDGAIHSGTNRAELMRLMNEVAQAVRPDAFIYRGLLPVFFSPGLGS